jgi:hypothetical protein
MEVTDHASFEASARAFAGRFSWGPRFVANNPELFQASGIP